jgi:hypothetical protein
MGDTIINKVGLLKESGTRSAGTVNNKPVVIKKMMSPCSI